MIKQMIVFICATFLLLSGIRVGDTSDVVIEEWTPSEIYSDEDIQSAMDTVEEYFSRHFSGCTLKRLWYPGDEAVDEWEDFAISNDADEAIVIYSSFDVDSSGGDGSLNPNSTYDNWDWILVRDEGGKWRHVDHGYG